MDNAKATGRASKNKGCDLAGMAILAGFGSAVESTPPTPPPGLTSNTSPPTTTSTSSPLTASTAPSPPTTESTSTSPPTEATDVIQLGDWQGPDSDHLIHDFASENAGLINLQTRSERIEGLEVDLSVVHSRITF